MSNLKSKVKLFSFETKVWSKKVKEKVMLLQGSDVIYQSEFDRKTNSLDEIQEIIDSVT